MAHDATHSALKETIRRLESDLAACREKQATLEAREDKYQIVSELTSDYAYAFRVETDGDIVNEWVTGAFRKLTGYSKDALQAIGGWETLILKEDIPVAIRQLKSLLAGDPASVEYRIVTQGGEIRWMSDYARPVRDKGRVTYIYGAVKDITELKAYEAERLQYEQKLQQSQKMEAIGTLAGGIAHDFNNILAAIIGYTELSLADLDSQSNIADNLKEVIRAGSRAKDLVKQILTFARQADEDLQPLMVSSVAKEVIKLLRSTLPVTITIEADIDSNALVLANVTQIHQIFMNLATNAAQAMEPRGGILTFTVSEVTWSENDLEIPVNLAPDRYLKISVADTGKGIAEEILPLIFEPYFTNKPTGEGTGLGLSVVHGIAKKYGGDVLVSSQVNQGAVFTVYLPIIRKYRPKQSRQGDTIPTGQGRILFVDDELFICDMFSQILERLGYTVTCRTSSVEALGLFRSKPNDFDLVITDMTMPNMTGDVLAAQLIQIRPEIPLVLCTGYSKSISEKKALEIGIRAFVMKPLVVKELANIVHGILNPSAAAPPNPKQ